MTRSRILSLDAWLFAALALIYIALYEDPKGITIAACLIAYLFLDLFRPWEAMRPESPASRRVFLAKFTLILLSIFMVTVVPAGLWIAKTRATGSVEFTHEGQLQVEAALNFIQQGQTPYGQDYTTTPMGQRSFNERGLLVSPALHHIAYLPLILEISYPLYWLGLKTLGWWDQRLLYIPLLILTLGLMPQLARHPARKLALVLIVGFNPLLMLGFVEGRNDILMILLIALSALAFQRSRPSAGVVAFALACSAKQLAWFAAPFVGLHLLGQAPWRRAAWANAAKQAWPGAALFIATLLPFLLWEPRGFLADTFGYMLGLGNVLSIAKGYGLAGLLLDAGVLKKVTDPFPFSVFELAFGLPALVLLLRHQLQQRDVRRLWQYGALLGFAVTFWARFFLDNYIGFFVMLIGLSAFMDGEGEE